MAGAGNVILFVVFLAGTVIWSGVTLIFATHYFLTTLIDSSAGQDEINFNNDTFVERGWKPVFCVWVLFFWIMSGFVLLVPAALWKVDAVAVLLPILVWLVYPVSVLSALVGGNWFYLIYPPILPRIARHFGPFIYVHLMMLLGLASSSFLLFNLFQQGLLWVLPTAFALSTLLLLYARHWGRFAWLSLNFAARKKARRIRVVDVIEDRAESLEQPIPEMDVEEVSETNDGFFVAGPPAVHDQSIQSGIPCRSAEGIQAGMAASAPIEEEEDEWSRDKKPYAVIQHPDHEASLPAYAREVADADKPIVISNYYDRRIEKERERERELQKVTSFLPPPSKKKPTFQAAMVIGVWLFMIYPQTLVAWGNLLVILIVELMLLSMLKQLWIG